jgi:signal transduction histidine kinase
MPLAVKRSFRWRSVSIFLAIAGTSSLVILPIIGLMRVDDATERSHEYTQLVSETDELSNSLLQLVTGPLARYGASHAQADREAAVSGLDRARSTLAALDSRAAQVAALGIAGPVSAHVGSARQVVEGSTSYLAEIDAGATIATAPSTPVVVNAASDLLRSQGEFTLALGPLRQKIDQERRDAADGARTLLIVAAGIAVLTLGSLVLVDGRLVQRRLLSEASRREGAERLAAHRADVVNMASHELRNPLTVLTLATGFLTRSAEERHDEDFSQLSRDAHAAALRCEALVDELLDLSRLDADRLQLKVGATPLVAALGDAVAMSESHHGHHTVQVSGDEAIAVAADPDRLRIILRNLIDNAFKYSPVESLIQVRIQEWDGRVRLDVMDEGVGIAPGDREVIFTRFARPGVSRQFSGIGIGLYLSRELARRMDGELRCGESERGASFLLELPLAAA